MNRTQPTASNLEIWHTGTVDATGTTLITFDNDNCLTALKKVSEAFDLPFYAKGEGGFHEYWVGIHLTNVKRRHLHHYDIGNGLAKIKTVRRWRPQIYDRPLRPGSTRNIPFDYRGGLKRLHCGSIGTTFIETVYDETANWTPSAVVPAGATADFASTNDPQSGSICVRVTSASVIDGTRINFTRDQYPIDVTGSVLRFWINGGDDFVYVGTNYYTIEIIFYSDDPVLILGRYTHYIWLKDYMNFPDWREVVIPMSAVNFTQGNNLVKRIQLYIRAWSVTAANGANFWGG